MDDKIDNLPEENLHFSPIGENTQIENLQPLTVEEIIYNKRLLALKTFEDTFRKKNPRAKERIVTRAIKREADKLGLNKI